MTASSEQRADREMSDRERGKKAFQEIQTLKHNLTSMPEYAFAAGRATFAPGVGTPLAPAGVDFQRDRFWYNVRFIHKPQADAEHPDLREDAEEQLVITKYNPRLVDGEGAPLKVGEVMLFAKYYKDPEAESDSDPEYSAGNAYVLDEQEKATTLPDPDTFDKIHKVFDGLYRQTA